MQLQWRSNFQHYFLGLRGVAGVEGRQASCREQLLNISDRDNASQQQISFGYLSQEFIKYNTYFVQQSSSVASLDTVLFGCFFSLLCSLEVFLLSLWEDIYEEDETSTF